MKYVLLMILTIYVMIIVVLLLKIKAETSLNEIAHWRRKLGHLKIKQMVLDAKVLQKYVS